MGPYTGGTDITTTIHFVPQPTALALGSVSLIIATRRRRTTGHIPR